MNRRLRTLRSEKGWTIIEFIIVVAIMSILYSVIGASYDALKAKVRFAQVKADFDSMTHAAFNDFTSSSTNDWAVAVMPGVAPSFAGGSTLNKWPQPPCAGWIYSWENYYGIPGVNSVRITLRKANYDALWSVCLQNYDGNCQGDDGFGAPTELTAVSSHYIYCNE